MVMRQDHGQDPINDGTASIVHFGDRHSNAISIGEDKSLRVKNGGLESVSLVIAASSLFAMTSTRTSFNLHRLSSLLSFM
jgi:hypothetical protein